jgi:hypothetical protein
MSNIMAILIFGLGLIVWFLWHIAEHLKAIRASLADIATATRDTSGGASYLSAIKWSTEKTETLLKLAIKKQWGNAIDLPRY